MFEALVALGVRSGAIHRVEVPDGRISTIHERGGPAPDGVVVRDGTVYWTTMGTPTVDPSRPGEDALDFSRRDGGVHSVRLDGTDPRDVLPDGSITTGKQLALHGDTLYWADREGCRVSRANTDGTGLTDLVVNTEGDQATRECVGVAVADGYLYWTQKGPSDGGVGRILRAGLEIPDGETASDRSDIEVLWDGLPEPIDLEICAGVVYWTDRGAPPAGNTLNRARPGAEPTILASGFAEAIGVTIDPDARVAYVSDLGGHVRAVPLDSDAEPYVLADLGEPSSGIAGVA